jgi:hypothetical protein
VLRIVNDPADRAEDAGEGGGSGEEQSREQLEAKQAQCKSPVQGESRRGSSAAKADGRSDRYDTTEVVPS